MSVSTFQKLTIVSCVVLCVALLLPKMLLSRGKRDAPKTEGPAGHFPPVLHKAPVSDEPHRSGRQFSRAHNPEAIARAKGAGTGASTGGKSNLAGQIIPIYGFAILLYILYLLFKITSKGKTTKPSENRVSAARSQNMKRKITDFELNQLQDRLNETRDVIEGIISAASVCSHSVEGTVAGHDEQRLLYQLKEITRVMQEGQLVDQLPANSQQQSCGHDWDDFAGDGENEVNQHFCFLHSPDVSSDTQTPPEESSETSHDNRAQELKTDSNRHEPIDDMSAHNITVRQRNTKLLQ
ncbi:protein RIC-3b isoform X1 [Triplophysa dalaica]|uniref:protein RIC-3b isoform X1 n=1 Tax=Triplophysa dalaica TaxID=1582913 RepID=UPI0024DFE9B0|nr:protein RIC-3b isoform X1 [Triplophysa dalaica]